MLPHIATRLRMRTTIVIAILAAVGVMTVAPAQGALSQRRADDVSKRTQPLLLIDQRVTARAHPSPRARIVGQVEARTPLTGAPTVLPVLQTARGPAGGRWLRVRLPMRPNSASGWVPADTGRIKGTPWRIIVHRGAHRALVLQGGKVRASYPIVVGQPANSDPARRLLRRREDPRRARRDRGAVGIGDVRVLQRAPRVCRGPGTGRPSRHRRAQRAARNIRFPRLHPIRERGDHVDRDARRQRNTRDRATLRSTLSAWLVCDCVRAQAATSTC